MKKFKAILTNFKKKIYDQGFKCPDENIFQNSSKTSSDFPHFLILEKFQKKKLQGNSKNFINFTNKIQSNSDNISEKFYH